MLYVNSRGSNLTVSPALRFSRRVSQSLWMIPGVAMFSASCSAQQSPVRPYDKLCEAQVGLLGNAITYAYSHPGTGLTETPDLISGLPKEEQTLARAACEEWGKRTLEKPTGLQICDRRNGKSLNCRPAK